MQKTMMMMLIDDVDVDDDDDVDDVDGRKEGRQEGGHAQRKI